MTDYNGSHSGERNAELEAFLMAQTQQAQMNAQIHELNDICWDKCVDKPSYKLDSRTEACITNCVGRFIDTSLLVANRFAQMLQKSSDLR